MCMILDYVLGTDRLFELPDVIEGKEGTSSVMTAFGHENMDQIEPIRETPHSGFVTISRGCDNYCTYCIVPYVRGKEGITFHFAFWDRLNAKLDALRDRGMGHYVMFYSDDALVPDRYGLRVYPERS